MNWFTGFNVSSLQVATMTVVTFSRYPQLSVKHGLIKVKDLSYIESGRDVVAMT